MIQENSFPLLGLAPINWSSEADYLAVTVLTSLNNSDLTEIGFQKDTKELVFHLAKLAQTAAHVVWWLQRRISPCCGLILALNFSS